MVNFKQALNATTRLRQRPSTDNIPLVDANDNYANDVSQDSQKTRWWHGFHFGIRGCAIAVALVLLINVILTITITTQNNADGGTVRFKKGDCANATRLDTWLHFLINLFSTTLLGASNYCMQCILAPTRRDINRVHSKRTWMDIGVPSIRNILHISWTRRILCFLLFVSSTPLHLTYNSVIFSSTSAVEYSAYVVTKDFFEDGKPTKNMTQAVGLLTDDNMSTIQELHD